MSEAPQCPYCGLSLPGNGGDAALGTRRNGHVPNTGNHHALGAASGRTMAAERALDSLYQEVRRIREIAETRPAEGTVGRAAEGAAARAAGDDRHRIEELTREVQELRITVARLRGMAVPGVARSA
jgi:hypothetical protein